MAPSKYVYSTTSINHNWFVLQCRPGNEFAVFIGLESHIKNNHISDISALIVQTEETVIYRKGKKFSKVKPLIPGYLYMKANLTNSVINLIQSGIITLDGKTNWCRFLVNGDRYKKSIAPIHPNQAAMFEKLISNEIKHKSIDELYKINDSVVINSSEPKNVFGVISSINNEIAVVSVNIFNRFTPVSVETRYLRRL